MTRIGSYDVDEVRVLVEEFEELRGKRSRAFIHVRLMDIERTLPRLDRPLREAVFLYGIYGLSAEKAGKAAGVAHSTILRRYERGLAQLVKKLNGGL